MPIGIYLHKSPSQEARDKCSVSLRKFYQTHKRPSILHTEETKKKISLSMKGVPKSLETRKKMSDYAKRNKEKGFFWRGGVWREHKREKDRFMKTVEYRFWRDSVFRRDNKTCVNCGSKDNLEADHIRPYSLYPKLRLDINNGRTLCRPCHVKLGWRSNQYLVFKRTTQTTTRKVYQNML